MTKIFKMLPFNELFLKMGETERERKREDLKKTIYVQKFVKNNTFFKKNTNSSREVALLRVAREC